MSTYFQTYILSLLSAKFKSSFPNFTVSKFYHIYAPISTGFASVVDYIFPMRTVYLDELFALNMCIDYFLLLGTAKVCARPYRRGRFALAAALGGLWCCLALLPAMAWLNSPWMKTALALGMTLAAFGPEKHLWRCFGAFLGISVMFGGAVYAAGLWRGTWQPGGALVRLDMRVLVLSFALCWLGLSLLFRRSAKKAERELHELRLCRNGRQVSLRALRDTGNELYDPLSGCSVLVADARALEPLFSPEQAKLLAGDPVEAVGAVEGLRLLPYRGLGAAGGLLACFRPEAVYLDGEARKDLLAAISPAPLSDDGSYQALF